NCTAGTQIVGLSGTNCITANAVGYFKLMDVDIYLAAGATSACVGLQLLSCFNAKVIDVRITNFSTSIYLFASVDCYVQRCYLSSTGATVSPLIGIDVDSSDSSIPHKQNASLYVSDCIADHAVTAGYSGSRYGYYLHGHKINDAFFDRCE